MKRNVAGIILASFGVIVGFGSIAYAQTNSAISDPIQNGLWRGASLTFGQQRTSTPQTTSSNTGGFAYPSTEAQTGGTEYKPTQTTGSYVALGDSVAAGLGLGSTTTGCGQSIGGYPNIVAQNLSLPLVNLACSGATAGDLYTKQRSTNMPAQLDGAFANGTPKLITITAGANDAHWVYFLKKCYAGTCGTHTDTALATTYLKAYATKLTYAFYDIKNRSGNNPPTVIITGYYNPISNYCIGRQTHVTAAEVKWLNAERDALNKTIRNIVADYPFVRYASTNFDSHSLCSSDPWVQGLNDPAPLHPNAKGQAAIAQSVLETFGHISQ